MMMGQNWGFGWGGMWFGWLMMIGFTVAVVVLIVWLIRLSTPGNSSAPGNDQRVESALDILQARYARGDISKEEYLDARATLLRT
jgi:putative membrane protein